MCLTAFPFDSVDFTTTGRTSNCSTRLVEHLRWEDRTLISFLALSLYLMHNVCAHVLGFTM